MKILRFSLVLATVVLASAILLSTSFVKADRDRDDDAHRGSPTPPGLFITPTALKDAVQQDLKPGFALPYFATNYPNFVAGEAVKALVSPDGTTLAVLTAGMNSLYFPNNDDLTNPNLGKVDTAASTQFASRGCAAYSRARTSPCPATPSATHAGSRSRTCARFGANWRALWAQSTQPTRTSIR